MSGGFFRGTSADQDTRFSNKQAKLLKSQKFAPELEHLVDMTKVKMDVMRPWIATRVTELIGFEDEVLINFIYGLLDGKDVNGKEVQISLTGFMERNTVKFMKELWSLLLSAQKNASGVPQQFLDAKEEETKKKKAESDRIATEIQRKKEKEGQELKQERKMDRGNDISKDFDTGVQPSSKHQLRVRSAKEKESDERNGLQGRSRVSKSPHSAGRSSSPRRSISKSFSNSRSYSRSRSLSASPRKRGRFSSLEMVHHSSPKRSLSPQRRHSPCRSLSPTRRSSYSRRRPLSRPHRRSPSPTRYRMRSPLHRRSRSPLRRRSRSPIWHRTRSPTQQSSPHDRSWSPLQHRSSSVRHRSPSPIRRNSPSPMRRKYRRSPSTPRHRSQSPIKRRSQSPIKRRSRSPIRRRSRPPIRRRSRSPIRRRSRSPIRRRSRSPIRRRSRSPIRRRSRSPIRRRSRSPIRRKSQSPSHHVSPSPVRWRSPIVRRRRSPSPANDKSRSPQVSSSPSPHHRFPSPIRRKSPRGQRSSPVQSPRGRMRRHEKSSPVRHAAPRNTVEHLTNARQRSNSSEHRSQSDSWDQTDSHRKVKRSSPSPPRSHYVSEAERETSFSEKKRDKIPRPYSPNPPGKARENKQHDDSYQKSADDKRTNYMRDAAKRKHDSPTRTSSKQPEKRDQMLQRENKSERIGNQKKSGQQGPQMVGDVFDNDEGKESPVGERDRAVEKNRSYSNDIKINDRHLEAAPNLSKKVQHNDQSASLGSDTEESDKSRAKDKNKRTDRRELESADESSYDSYAEERKEAKRRRKEEKRLKKEDRRRRREERRRRKEGRRAEKQKLKSKHAVSSPSDTKNHSGHSDDDHNVEKNLEIELRERALESLRAKKGIGH